MIDHDIRSALHKTLAKQFQDLNFEIIHELGLARGSTRVDVAVVARTGLYGFEIKSDVDVLKRLPGQVKLYSEVCDYASVVTTTKHLEEVVGMLPTWWGIFLASDETGKVKFKVNTLPQKNPTLNITKLTRMLWRDEALEFLKRRGEDRGLQNKAKRHAWERIQKVASPDEIKAFLRERLKARTKMASVGGWKVPR
jgi:hypothetical protein